MRKSSTLCSTIIFMFGSIVGILAGHSTDLTALFTIQHVVTVIVASLVFYFTQSKSLFSIRLK